MIFLLQNLAKAKVRCRGFWNELCGTPIYSVLGFQVMSDEIFSKTKSSRKQKLVRHIEHIL